jgi:hypothetical protein
MDVHRLEQDVALNLLPAGREKQGGLASGTPCRWANPNARLKSPNTHVVAGTETSRTRGQYPAPPQVNYGRSQGISKWPIEVPESGPWISAPAVVLRWAILSGKAATSRSWVA